MNLALLCQKEELFGEALKWCEKALQEQPANAKAVYRQAQVSSARLWCCCDSRLQPDAEDRAAYLLFGRICTNALLFVQVQPQYMSAVINTLDGSTNIMTVGNSCNCEHSKVSLFCCSPALGCQQKLYPASSLCFVQQGLLCQAGEAKNRCLFAAYVVRCEEAWGMHTVPDTLASFCVCQADISWSLVWPSLPAPL